MHFKRIAVSGIGGVGGYYGAMLALGAQAEGLGREVFFVARGEHLSRIQACGLHVVTPTRDFVVAPTQASNDPNDIGAVDLVILATKSYDLEANIQQLKPMIAEYTVILPLLNGADIAEQIRQILPKQEVWQGCTYISGRKGVAGEVYLETDKESLYFGSFEERRNHREQELLKFMVESGINAHNPDEIGLVIRKKFIAISATATGTSYFDSPIGRALSEHPIEMRALVEEVCAVSIAEGFDLGDEAVLSAIKRQDIMPRESTSSMHVDFQNSRRTELENLTGYVVRKGLELGIPTPAYATMYEALRAKSAH